jgi:hypothetical protein
MLNVKHKPIWCEETPSPSRRRMTISCVSSATWPTPKAFATEASRSAPINVKSVSDHHNGSVRLRERIQVRRTYVANQLEHNRALYVDVEPESEIEH